MLSFFSSFMNMKNDHDTVKEPTIPYGEEFTYGDYLKFDFEYMVELIRGKIFKMSPAPSTLHQIVVKNLVLDFGNYLRNKDCDVYIAPFDVVLPVQNRKNKNKNTTVVQPDLVVICDPTIVDNACCFGVPDLLVEAISPHTKKKDIRLKYEVYEEAGVSEYWVVYPLEKILEIFLLRKGKYEQQGKFIEGDFVSPSMIPGLKVDLTEVFDYKV